MEKEGTESCKNKEKRIQKLANTKISNWIEADSKDAAKEKVDTACKKLLCNPIIEGYHFELNEG